MEIWKSVVGFEGLYDVSDLGRVRRLYDGGVNGWRILKPSLNQTGTGYFQLTLHAGGKIRRSVLLHHLVAEAFIGPKPSPEMVVCHNDGDSRNNIWTNLRYDTFSANMMDRVEHGTHNKGQRHGMSKLTDEQAADIKRRYVKGGAKALAEEFGVARHTITRIASGKTWQQA
jgi:hypothetical protein